MNILVEYRENFFGMEDFFITEMYSIFRLNSSETIASTAVDIRAVHVSGIIAH